MFGVIKGRFTVALVVLFVMVVVGFVSSPAAAATRHRPVVGQAFASRNTLPAAGAAVRVSIQVRYATRCVIYADRKAGAVRMGKLGIVSCGQGHARFTLPAVPNLSASSIRVHFRVVARGSGGHDAGEVLYPGSRRAVSATTARADPECKLGRLHRRF